MSENGKQQPKPEDELGYLETAQSKVADVWEGTKHAVGSATEVYVEKASEIKDATVNKACELKDAVIEKVCVIKVSQFFLS